MPKLEADFSQISHEFEPVPADSYRMKLAKIEEKETKENKLPALNIENEITEGPFAGRKIYDFVTLKTKDGKPNTIGLGRMKAYAIAILGEEAANGGAIDTDQLVGSMFDGVVSQETYAKKPENGGGQGIKNELVKILPIK